MSANNLPNRPKDGFIYTSIRSAIFTTLIYPAQNMLKPGKKRYDSLRKDYEDCFKAVSSDEVPSNIEIKIPNLLKTEYAINNSSQSIKFKAEIFSSEQNIEDTYKKDAKYIIYTTANASCYEAHALEMFEDFNKNNATVIGFHPPGVGQSPGSTRGPEDYKNALRAIIDDLHAKGIPYNNITIKGHSLGAAIALEVAAETQTKGEGVAVIADRTFDNLSNASAEFVRRMVPFGGNLKNLVSRLIKYLNLEIDSKTAFEKINQTNPGNAFNIATQNDNVLGVATLHNALDDNQKKYSVIFEPKDEKDQDHIHNLYKECLKLNEKDIQSNTEICNAVLNSDVFLQHRPNGFDGIRLCSLYIANNRFKDLYSGPGANNPSPTNSENKNDYQVGNKARWKITGYLKAKYKKLRNQGGSGDTLSNNVIGSPPPKKPKREA